MEPQRATTLRDIQRKAMKTPVMNEAFAKFSMEPLNISGDEITAEMRKEVDALTKLVRSSNIKF